MGTATLHAKGASAVEHFSYIPHVITGLVPVIPI